MFIAALFAIAKTWKQPKCPSTEEWIMKMWYIYTIEYYLAMEMNEIMPMASTWIDLEIIILSEVKSERQIPYEITNVWNLIINDTKELTKQNRPNNSEAKETATKGNT